MPKKDIWVRSRYMGLTARFGGLFDETLTEVLKNEPIKAQGYESFHTGVHNIAKFYPYVDDTRADQGYVKAVVTIGDGGNVTIANTHTETYEANKAAIDNDVIVFSILANNPFAGTESAMTALSEGGLLPRLQVGSKPFQLQNTKGTLSKTEDNHLREDLERIICGVAQSYRAPLCGSQLSVRAKFGKVQVMAKNKNSDYSLYRGSSFNSTATKIATLPKKQNYFLDKKVQSSTNYYYQLKKENARGEPECESPIVSAYVPEYISDKDFNLAPIFSSRPPSEIKVGKVLDYTIKAIDFEGDTVNFRLLDAPASAKLVSNNLQWKASFQESSEFTIEARDSKGASDIHNFVLKVNNIRGGGGVNSPPVITSIPFLSGVSHRPYRYQLTAEDTDGDQIYYYFLSSVPQGLKINHKTGAITWQQPPVGVYPIKIAATDFQADTTQSFTLTIYGQNYNKPPQITSRPVTKGNVDSAYQYQVVAQDPESKPLTYAFDKFAIIPAGMKIDRNTGLITWLTPRTGQYRIKWYVTDGINATVQNYLLTVTPSTNKPPIVTSRPVRIAKIAQPYRYQVVAKDPAGDLLSYSLSGDLPKGMSIDNNGLLTWNYPLLGSYTITVKVDDGHSIVTQKYILSVQKTLNTVSRYAPEFVSQPITYARESIRYSYHPKVNDLDANPLSYSLKKKPQGMTIRDSTGQIVWVKPFVGKHKIIIVVTDGKYTAEQQFTLTVLPKAQSGNQPPQISSKPKLQIEVGQAFTYQVIADDPENQPLTYSVGGYGTPNDALIDNKTGLLTWKNPTAGIYTLQINVSDGENLVTQNWTLYVRKPRVVNKPPKFTTKPPRNMAVGDDYFYQAHAVDPEGKTVTYFLNGTVPSRLTLNRDSGLIQWKNLSPGYYHFMLIASDGEKITTQPITIRPQNDNKPPIFTTTPTAEGNENSPYFYQATAVDPERNTVKYSLSGNIPSGMSIDEGSGKVNWSKPQKGIYHITIEASDGYQSSTQKYQLVITKVAINKPPIFRSIPKTSIAVNQSYSYQAIVQDPEGKSISFKLKQSPKGMVISPYGTVKWKPNTIGNYSVTIVASDGTQGGEQTFTIKVTQPKPVDSTLIKAANWIKSQTQATGEIIAKISLSTPYQATDEAVQATALINQTINSHQVSNYLLKEKVWLAEHLARKAAYQQSVGQSAKTTLTALHQHYNSRTGSYSSFIDESGNLLDTAHALIAQAKTAKNKAVLGYAINYLKSEQLNDGSYRLPKNNSSIYVTAKVLQAIRHYDNYGTANNKVKAKNYLLTQLTQKYTTLPDWELAQTLLVLYEVSTDKSSLSAYITDLKQRQQSNGSFSDDVYSTALAIQAIYLFDQ